MIGILANHKHKWLYNGLTVISSIDTQLALCVLMAGNTVQQHQFIQLLVTKIVKIYVGAGNGKGRTSIPVLDSF